jgi:2-dehydropantoate 2-reductase
MEKNLKIGIIGIGGVGGYIGAKLTKAKKDIVLIARDKHYKVIQQNGLKVIEKDSEFIVYPNIINSNDNKKLKNTVFDILFIASKSYDFKNVCESIKNLIDDNTIIIPLANGVEHKNELKNYLSKGIICDGTIYIISNLKEYSVVSKKADTFFLIFGNDENSSNKKLDILENILNQSDLKTKHSKSIKYDCWKKYLFISSFASLTSYFKKPMGYIVNEQRELLVDLLKEIKDIANTLDIPIDDKDIEKTINQALNVPYDSKTSMQIDFEKAHKTELNSLCGYIVREGEKLNIQTPNMKKIYDKLLKR